jgi:cytochrome P450
VNFVPAVGLWLVTRHDDVKRVTKRPETFTAATEPSTLNRTMGENMLGMEGPGRTSCNWNEGLMPGLANFEGDPDKQAPADEAAAALHAAIGDVLDRLADDADGSVLSWMLHREEDGRRTSREQIVANTTLMLSGGLRSHAT